MRMMTEGLRWSNGSAAWHFWDAGAGAHGEQTIAYSPVAVLCREWNWTFGGGRRVSRTLKVLNHTSSDEPIRWSWSFSVDGRKVAGGEQTVRLPIAGRTGKIVVQFDVPPVSHRTPATFALEAYRDGERVFQDRKAAWIIATEGPRPKAREGEILVFDPHGEAAARLRERGIAFQQADSIDGLRGRNARLVIVGRDAVPEERSSDLVWQHMVLDGARLLVLEQEHPLHNQSLPADLQPVGAESPRRERPRGAASQGREFTGNICFPEDLSHPAFRGLGGPDFFCWSGDHACFKRPYRKAERGAKSLLHCHTDLAYTVLGECPLADSTMLLSQCLVGTKLSSDPVAQRLFDNMVEYAFSYEPVRRKTAVVMPVGPRSELLKKVRLEAMSVDGPLAAMREGEIAIVDATPENLRRLLNGREQVRAFTAGGGWLVLWGLTPAGLDDFNRLAGTDHIIRPATMERAEVALPRHRLAAGLSARDVVMETERLNTWSAVMWMADDEFSHVLDLDDVAPFATINGEPPRHEAARTSAPRNVVNGFTRAKHWEYIYFIDMSDGTAPAVTFALPRRETLTRLDIVPNATYWKPRELRVEFDDAEEKALTFEIAPAPERQSLEFPAPVRARIVRLVLGDFISEEGVRPVAGFENVWLHAQRPEGFRERVQPLLNIGGLIAYPRGDGGILLNQLAVPAVEKNPANARKRANIVKAVLGNLNATFGGSHVVVPGARSVSYHPVQIDEQTFNAYSLHGRNPGWFRDGRAKDATLAGMKTGEQELAEVRYELYDLVTSPTPSVIMLAGDGSQVEAGKVHGIPVGRRADALFFLHAYNAGRQAQRWQHDVERGRASVAEPVVFVYRVNYADGTAADVPVVYGRDVAHWLQEDPADLAGAALATALPAEGHPELKVSLYSMQWSNPEPAKVVRSIDLLPGTVGNPGDWGAPALIAITAATTE